MRLGIGLVESGKAEDDAENVEEHDEEVRMHLS